MGIKHEASSTRGFVEQNDFIASGLAATKANPNFIEIEFQDSAQATVKRITEGLS